jgi:hypothetical protein
VFLRHVAVRRSDAVAGIAVAVIVIGAVSAAVAIDLNRDDGPSAADCAAAWNAPSNRANQVAMAAAGWKRAAVSGWLNEEIYPGCAVTFVHRPAGPWIAFSRETSGKAWYRESGLRWGHDNREGAEPDDNARVSSSGLLFLD